MFYINFKRARAVGFLKALKEEIPLHFLDGEATLCDKVSKVGCHKKVLVVLWGHTQSFGCVKFMVVA
jgi:hypothetical protein